MPDPVATSADDELRARVERVLTENYAVESEVGRGGMGIVYRARDRRLKRAVAVKLLPPELAFRPEIRTRFLREAETAAGLSHPSIVPIYTVDERDGLVYFVMAYIDGETLGQRMQERGPLPVDDVRRILCEVSDALAYAHSRGVVHRDIKPDNILLDGETGRPMVTDFGIARAVSESGDSRLTATGMAIGTPAYMSPEQSAGERDVDGRSDLYSLGVVGYQMLCGVPPFTAGSTPALLVKHLSERPVPVSDRRPDIPPDLAEAVMRLLAKDPADRYATASDLEAVLEGRGHDVAPPRNATAERAALLSPMALGGNRGGTYPGWGGQSVDRAPAPPVAANEHGMVTDEEMRRWSAPEVERFRKKVAPFLIVNLVILLLSIITNNDFLFVTAFWSIGIAFQYAKLWSDGYDWRDVFKQPRDRLFADVAAETVDDAKALFDPEKREQVRERARQRRLSSGGRPLFGGNGSASARAAALPVGAPAAPTSGPYAGAIRQAVDDRAEIARLVSSMPASERRQVGDVSESAAALLAKVQGLAASLAELDRNDAPGALDVIEREISTLEAAANPLDHAASEDRVRRLAYLKRQRRAVGDVSRRRSEGAARLESCRLALQNMRYDLVRLRTGSATLDQVTLVAERAMALARDVDGALEAAEIAKGSSSPTSRAFTQQATRNRP